MKTHTVAGGGGVRLHVVETGNPQGSPIVFLHGGSHCSSLERSCSFTCGGFSGLLRCTFRIL
jgi:pimeloyl-ACP methyl ester carboxylesterase